MIRSGARQHVIPQQMIRRFAGADGLLYCLDKETLTIGNKPKSATQILWTRNYYRDSGPVDFDETILKPIENRFGSEYGAIAKGPWTWSEITQKQRDLLTQWVNALFCRTELPKRLNTAICGIRRRFDKQPHSEARILMMDEHLKLLRSWQWVCLQTVEDLILTDQPFCTVGNIDGTSVPSAIVPFARRLLLVGSAGELPPADAKPVVREWNRCIAGWAYRWIHAAERETLEGILRFLRGNDVEAARAQKPLLGIMEAVNSPETWLWMYLSQFSESSGRP